MPRRTGDLRRRLGVNPRIPPKLSPAPASRLARRIAATQRCEIKAPLSGSPRSKWAGRPDSPSAGSVRAAAEPGCAWPVTGSIAPVRLDRAPMSPRQQALRTSRRIRKPRTLPSSRSREHPHRKTAWSKPRRPSHKRCPGQSRTRQFQTTQGTKLQQRNQRSAVPRPKARRRPRLEIFLQSTAQTTTIAIRRRPRRGA